MSDSHYQEVADGVYCIETGLYRHGLAACYLVRAGDRLAFVETGTSRSVPRMLDVIADLGLGPENVDYVIPTHVHLDHCNCLEVIILKGRGTEVKEFSDRLLSLRGVQHGKLVLTNTGVSSNPGHKHRH